MYLAGKEGDLRMTEKTKGAKKVKLNNLLKERLNRVERSDEIENIKDLLRSWL
jgi:hypothetical protein